MSDITPLTSPFHGPRPFQTGEALYGRDYEARTLLSMLIAERVVLLHSPSGAGKTSLIQAALIPLLEERVFTVLPTIRVGQEVPPGSDENRYLRSTLLSLEEGWPEEERLSSDELARLPLADYLARTEVLGTTADPQTETTVALVADRVLIFDQFEEVLTRDPTDEAAKEAYFRALSEALALPRVWALFVTREEYVAALEPYTRLLPTRLAAHFRLDLLGPEGALAALREPPRAVGVDVPAELAARLIDDLRRVNVQLADGTLTAQLGPSVEPVQLQVVGLRLWELLPRGATALTEVELTALGDVGSALGDYYAQQVAAVAAGTGVSERALRTWFDRALITPQGVRAEVLQGSERSAGLDNAAIQALVDAYLVRAEPRRGATWYELAHDRLIAPVRAGNAAWFVANLSTLQRQADLWDQQGRPAGLLLRGQALREAEDWAAANAERLTEAERDLLGRSQVAERQGRRVRTLAIGATVLSVVALIAFLTALWFFARAEQQRREARARELAAAAVSSLPVDPQRSLLLAQAAVSTTRDPGEPVVAEAVEALQQATQASRVRQIVQVGERGLQDIAASPNGNILATSGNDGVVRLFDAHSFGEMWATAVGDRAPYGLTFSPDGTNLAAGVGAEVGIWDVAGGAELRRLGGDGADITDVAYRPDGAAILGADADGLVRVWDTVSGAELLALEASGPVEAVAFSPDGTQLTVGDAGAVVVWDASSGAEVLRLEGHTGDITDIAYEPAGNIIASASTDLSVRLWDAATGEPLDVLRGHTTTVETVAFSADGAMLASASQDGTARVWAVADGRPVLILAGHTNGLSGALFSQDGKVLFTASLDGSLRRWYLGLAPEDGAYLVTFSPDGRQLATGGAAGARLWDAESGSLLATILHDGVEISALTYSRDGTLLALGDTEGHIQLVDAETGEEAVALEGHTEQINRLAFSPDGKLLVSVSDDRSARVWDVRTGEERQRFEGHDTEAQVVAWSPDATLVASGDYAGAIALWEPSTGTERLRLTLFRNEIVQGLAFSPDGRELAAADEGGQLVVWELPGGAERLRRSTGRAIRDLAYRPDGQELATVGADQAVQLWEAARLTLLATLPLPTEGYSLTYRPDGRALATATADGQARVFLLALDDLLALAEQQTMRSPSPEECTTFRLSDSCPVGQP